MGSDEWTRQRKDNHASFNILSVGIHSNILLSGTNRKKLSVDAAATSMKESMSSGG